MNYRRTEGVDPSTFEYDASLLTAAIRGGNVLICRLLVQNKADVNHIIAIGESMLHEAILKGNLVIVKLLVEYGANLNYYHSPAVSGPVYMAIVKRHYEICKFLIEKGADPELVGQN